LAGHPEGEALIVSTLKDALTERRARRARTAAPHEWGPHPSVRGATAGSGQNVSVRASPIAADRSS
jgi:hypothetical protein